MEQFLSEEAGMRRDMLVHILADWAGLCLSANTDVIRRRQRGQPSPLDISKTFYVGNSNMTQYRTHTFSYDTAGQLLSIQHLQGTNAIGAISYGYNSGGNRTNRVESGGADAYSYDAVDQITGVNYSTNRTVSYAYDALGNRSSVTDNNVATAYTANNLNQYTVVGGSGLGYDAKGNLISGPGSASYTYDGNNRLTSATVGTNSATFAHDARMRNLKRVINGQTRFFYFDGWSLVQERDGSGNVVQNYVNGSRIDEIIRKTDSGGAVYYHSDALGSTVALTDGAGAVVERYSYDVFGTPTVRDDNGNVIAASAYANRFLFTGREWIKEVGVYDYRNRIFSAALGRFLQTDPIRFQAGDMNLYRYVVNGSVKRRDPLGLFGLFDGPPMLDDPEPSGWPLDVPFDLTPNDPEQEPTQPTPQPPPPTTGGYIGLYSDCKSGCEEPDQSGEYEITCTLKNCKAGTCPPTITFRSTSKEHGEIYDTKGGFDPFAPPETR